MITMAGRETGDVKEISDPLIDDYIAETIDLLGVKPMPNETVAQRKTRLQEEVLKSVQASQKELDDPSLTKIDTYLRAESRAMCYFRFFLKKIFCVENLLFHICATKFLDDKPDQTPEEAAEEEDFMFNNYLLQDVAPFWVNLPARIEKDLKSFHEEKEPVKLRQAIEEARSEVWSLMSGDSFRKFMKSECWATFLRREIMIQKKKKEQHKQQKMLTHFRVGLVDSGLG